MTTTNHARIDVPLRRHDLGDRTRLSADVAYTDGQPTFRDDTSVNIARTMLDVYDDGRGLAGTGAWRYRPGPPIDEEAWIAFGAIETIDDPNGVIADYRAAFTWNALTWDPNR